MVTSVSQSLAQFKGLSPEMKIYQSRATDNRDIQCELGMSFEEIAQRPNHGNLSKVMSSNELNKHLAQARTDAH
jgi:hypothetical protein